MTGDGEGTLHCRRCDADVPVIRPWRGWKPLWTTWKVGLVGWIVMFPFVASDFCVMLPSMMLYIAAGGPLRAYARQPPICRRCSLEIGPKSGGDAAARESGPGESEPSAAG